MKVYFHDPVSIPENATAVHHIALISKHYVILSKHFNYITSEQMDDMKAEPKLNT